MRISNASNWLFWKSFTNGNASIGRKSVSPKMGDQWERAERTLCRTRRSFRLLTGYLRWMLAKAECVPLSTRAPYAAWFSGRLRRQRQMNILQTKDDSSETRRRSRTLTCTYWGIPRNPSGWSRVGLGQDHRKDDPVKYTASF